MNERFRLLVEAPRIPLPVECWIVPPVPAAPVPVTVSPPLEPVGVEQIPFAAPFEEMLWKVRPLAPIVVLATSSAVPVVVVSVSLRP